MAGERASVTFHLRPHPDALLSDMQTAGEFMERFYGGVQRINVQRTAHATAPAAVPAAAAGAAAAGNMAPATTAASAAAAPAAACDNNHRMLIYIKRQDGREIPFRVRVQTLAARLHDRFCEAEGRDNYKLLFDGKRLDANRTLEWHGITDGDVIDAFVVQIGD